MKLNIDQTELMKRILTNQFLEKYDDYLANYNIILYEMIVVHKVIQE
jgi:hypothetical protein